MQYCCAILLSPLIPAILKSLYPLPSKPNQYETLVEKRARIILSKPAVKWSVPSLSKQIYNAAYYLKELDTDLE